MKGGIFMIKKFINGAIRVRTQYGWIRESNLEMTKRLNSITSEDIKNAYERSKNTNDSTRNNGKF